MSQSELTKYDFRGMSLRVILRGGDPWFVTKDAALALGYDQPHKARAHCKHAQPIGGVQNGHPSEIDPQTIICPESDLYRMILRSDKPEAEEFQAFVTEEVLPSIRKTGRYGSSDPVAFLDDPVALRMLLAERNDQFIEMKPKADAYDLIASTDGTVCVTDAAKMLNVRRKDLTKWLLENKWAYRRNGNAELVGYRNREQQGLVEHVYHETTNNLGDTTMRMCMRITAKGMQRLADAFKIKEAA